MLPPHVASKKQIIQMLFIWLVFQQTVSMTTAVNIDLPLRIEHRPHTEKYRVSGQVGYTLSAPTKSIVVDFSIREPTLEPQISLINVFLLIEGINPNALPVSIKRHTDSDYSPLNLHDVTELYESHQRISQSIEVFNEASQSAVKVYQFSVRIRTDSLPFLRIEAKKQLTYARFDLVVDQETADLGTRAYDQIQMLGAAAFE